MKYIFKIENIIVTAEKALIAVFVAAMITGSFLQLSLRLLFHSGIVWLDPMLRHMVLWTGLTGAALASRYAKHFALDAMVRFLPAPLRKPVEIFTDLFSIAVAGLLAGAARKFIRDEFASSSVAFYAGNFAVKGGWAGLILPTVFILIAFHTALNMFRPIQEQKSSDIL